MFQILQKKFLKDTVVSLKISAPLIANKVKVGQFVMVRIDEKGERIPLTISDFNKEEGSITLVVQAVGKTTILLSKMSEGDYIMNVTGPLGCPTEFGEPKKAIVIGGGVGCAIALPQAKALKKMGASVDMIAGFRNKDLLILEDEMRAAADNLYIATDDGSYGEKGLVTDILKRLASKESYDLVVAIGPIPMMKFVSLTTKELGIKTIVSLNPIMIDGTGMCGGCRVHIGGNVKFACVDGPDFDGHLVDFDELMRRNRAYADIETQKKDHICRLEGQTNGK